MWQYIGERFLLANYKREHLVAAEDGSKQIKFISPLDYYIESDGEDLDNAFEKLLWLILEKNEKQMNLWQ